MSVLCFSDKDPHYQNSILIVSSIAAIPVINTSTSDLSNGRVYYRKIMMDSIEESRANSNLIASVVNDHNKAAFKWHDLTDPIGIKFWDDPSRTDL